MKFKEIENYIYYDRPLLSKCKGDDGNLYLELLVEEDEEKEVWLYSRVSEGEIEQLEDGAVDLRSLYEIPPNRAIFAVTYFDQKDPQTEATVASLIQDKWLPKSGLKLK